MHIFILNVCRMSGPGAILFVNVMKKLKEVVDSDEISSITFIVHCENVGDIHHSHSLDVL